MKNTILVSITAQQSGLELIKTAQQERGSQIFIATVLPKHQPAAERAQALITLNGISQQSGYNIMILYSDFPADTMAMYARSINAGRVITGLPGQGSRSFKNNLALLLPEIPVTTCAGNFVATIPAFSLLNQL